MKLGRVTGTVTPSMICEGLEGVPMLIVQPLSDNLAVCGPELVMADATGTAGPEELIYYEGGREAALALEKWFVPVDHSIIGIVDGISEIDEK